MRRGRGTMGRYSGCTAREVVWPIAVLAPQNHSRAGCVSNGNLCRRSDGYYRRKRRGWFIRTNDVSALFDTGEFNMTVATRLTLNQSARGKGARRWKWLAAIATCWLSWHGISTAAETAPALLEAVAPPLAQHANSEHNTPVVSSRRTASRTEGAKQGSIDITQGERGKGKGKVRHCQNCPHSLRSPMPSRQPNFRCNQRVQRCR